MDCPARGKKNDGCVSALLWGAVLLAGFALACMVGGCASSDGKLRAKYGGLVNTDATCRVEARCD